MLTATIVMEDTILTALQKSLDTNFVVTDEYREFVIFDVFKRFAENYKLADFAARWGITLVLLVAVILQSTPVAAANPNTAHRYGAPKHSARVNYNDFRSMWDRPPVWAEPMMRDYLQKTYGIVYPTYSGPITIINPYCK
jgi:hypothetical protein